MATDEPPKRRVRLRFSLGLLLVLTLCVCALMGSYQYGVKIGSKQRYDESFFVKTYSVADLLADAKDHHEQQNLVTAIMTRLKARVAPESWTGPGVEMGNVQRLLGSGSLVVEQHGAIHDQVAAALHDFRREANRERSEAANDELNELAKQHTAESVVLASFPQGDQVRRAAIEDRYESLLDGVTTHRGRPRYVGKCVEPGFPRWSVAQSLAVWSLGDGEAYLAIQDDPTLGQVVVAGWRKAE